MKSICVENGDILATA